MQVVLHQVRSEDTFDRPFVCKVVLEQILALPTLELPTCFRNSVRVKSKQDE